MVWNRTNWYVWIWLLSPLEKLHVQGSGITRWLIETTWNWEANFELWSNWNRARLFYRQSDWAYGIFLPKQDGTGTRTVFRIKWNHDIILDWWADANVWIGTFSPNYKLDVNGSFGITPWIWTTVTPVSNGDLTISTASNTSVVMRLKGSDWVIRSTTLTLS